jgi:hypothetical protein
VRFTRAVPAVAAALAIASLSACSGGGGSATPSSSAPAVARWWSNAAATPGSAVDPHNPGALAAGLQPSQHDYCGMLAQTVSAGTSLFPTGTESVPLDTLQAFVAELQHVAPSAIAPSWRVLGPALVSYVRTSGASLGSRSPSDVSNAVTAIAADAKSTCHLDLSRAAAAISRPSH